MTAEHSIVRTSRRRPLAACIASLFALSAPVAALANTWIVDTCDGNDTVSGDIAQHTGSLRFAIANANDQDTIDLGTLQCANSTISLTTGGHVVVSQSSLLIKGPAASPLTIDAAAMPAGYSSGLLYHTGLGTLTVQNLKLSGGHVGHQYIDGKGGCIYSTGSVKLDHADLDACVAQSDYQNAKGGAIYAKGDVTIDDSLVTGSFAIAGSNAKGGGVYAAGKLVLQLGVVSGNKASGTNVLGGGAMAKGDFTATYSTISDNVADGTQLGYGGGLLLAGKLGTISASTISGNSAGEVAAIDVAAHGAAGSSFQISNSTVSGNTASANFIGGIRVGSKTAKFYNTTIAFNTALFGGPTAATGVEFNGDYGPIDAIFESTLVANNSHQSIEEDVGEFPAGTVTVNGGLTAVPANNLIRTNGSVTLPTDTKTACPLLGPLRDNGGVTQTHAPLSGSPAIDAGNDYFLVDYDQRGTAGINGSRDFLRRSGPANEPNPVADIGAHEVQQADVVFDTAFEGC